MLKPRWAARSICVASSDRLGGKIQNRAGREFQRDAFVGTQSFPPLPRTGEGGGANGATFKRETNDVFRTRALPGRSRGVESVESLARVRPGSRSPGRRGLRNCSHRNVAFGSPESRFARAGIGLIATFFRVNVALLLGALWTIPVGVAIGFSPQNSRASPSHLRKLRHPFLRQRCFQWSCCC